VKYTKPALSLDQQVEHLRAKGMVGDPAEMARRLATVNYYRLSAYWHTFRENGGERLIPGTSFDVVWGRYAFDRELRLLVMDAIERFEVAVRTRLAYDHAMASGPFGYIDCDDAAWKSDPEKRAKLERTIEDALGKNAKEAFVEHFVKSYRSDHPLPPVWLAVEILTFGDIAFFYRGSPRAIQRSVAAHFGVVEKVFESWLRAMNAVRNVCAHHGRLWNRKLGVQPLIPRDAEWHQPVEIVRERVFAVLTILAHVMRHIAPGSTWAVRTREMLVGAQYAPLPMMGFPDDWQSSPIWMRAWESAEEAP